MKVAYFQKNQRKARPTCIFEENATGYTPLNIVNSAAQVTNAGDVFYDSATNDVTFRPIGAPRPFLTRYRLYIIDDNQPLTNIPNNEQGWGRVSVTNIVAQAPTSWEAGVRYFDAARSYGWAEAFLSSWLARRQISADTVVVGSKWGYT